MRAGRRRASLTTLLLARSFASVRGLVEIRLFAPSQPLAARAALSLPDEQRHYLANVMRAKPGGKILLFNGVDGEWSASIDVLDKKRCELLVIELTRPQPTPIAAAPTLLFGVLKGQRLPTLIEKCTELGCGDFMPVVMRHCAARSLNVPRLQAIATEAAEQSRRLTVPTVHEPVALADALAGWEPSRPLFVCDELGHAGGAPPLGGLAAELAAASPGILIGPEGGLAAEERTLLQEQAFVRAVSLGANTLRAETAAMAACALLSCR